MIFQTQQNVIHEGRPAVVITEPDVGATGATIYGIRYTDMPAFQELEGFPGMKRPTRGSCTMARAQDLTAA